MLHEYAIEPTALSSFNAIWQALEEFGVPSGRLISNFPSNWQRMVYEATAACPPVQRKTLEVRLQQLKSKLIQGNRTYDSKKTWRENAYQAHMSTPFHAIIQADNASSETFVLTDLDLHAQNALWRISTQKKIQRTPDKMASAIKLLGQISRELLFIDPYFTPEKRWVCVLSEFLKMCQVKCGKFSRLELHTGSRVDKFHLEQQSAKWISPLIPSGITMQVFMWDQIPGGENLHPRYLLTDRGGIGFDVGLDAGEPGETTDVRLLSHELYLDRWREFQISTSAYKLSGKFTISSRCK